MKDLGYRPLALLQDPAERWGGGAESRSGASFVGSFPIVVVGASLSLTPSAVLSQRLITAALDELSGHDGMTVVFCVFAQGR